MLHPYLGSYLLNNQLISREILSELLQDQRKTHIKLGVLAINKGLMSASQVNEINELQKTRDKKFGELAVEKGYLTNVEVADLLGDQKSSNVELSQLLLDNEIFSLEVLEDIMKDYREYIKQCEPEQSSSLNNDLYINALLSKYLSDEELPFYVNYIKLIHNSFVRFIDFNSTLGNLIHNSYMEHSNAVLQAINGDICLDTSLCMSEQTYLQIASRYSKMPITELDELADASVTEFLNLANGLFTIQASDIGYNISLNPPIAINRCMRPWKIIVPILTDIGPINIGLVKRDF